MTVGALTLCIAALVAVGYQYISRLALILRQPPVAGLMIAGLVVGALIDLVGERGDSIFPVGISDVFTTLAELGMIFILFEVGEDLRRTADNHPDVRPGRLAAANIVMLVLPVVILTCVVYLAVKARVLDGGIPTLTVLFLGLALAASAVPVMFELIRSLGVVDRVSSRVALNAAVYLDGVIWLGVAAISVLAGGTQNLRPLPVCAGGLTVVLLAVFVPRVAARIASGRESMRTGNAVVLAVLAAGIGAAATNAIGAHGAVGACLVGYLCARSPELVAALEPVRALGRHVLFPIFIVHTLAAAPVTALLGIDPAAGAAILAILLTSFAAKVGAGLGGGRLLRLDWPESWQIGILLNCRGVTEIAIAAIGYSSGLIGRQWCATLILIACITTFATAPLYALSQRVMDRNRWTLIR